MAGVKNRCLIAAGAIVVSLTADALAQLTMPGIDLSADRPQLTKEEQEKRKAVDDAYKSTLNKLPDKKKPADPWGDISLAGGEFVQATVARPGFPYRRPQSAAPLGSRPGKSCARAAAPHQRRAIKVYFSR